MACMEHECVECPWATFDNAPRTSCPVHGPESTRHHFDEPEHDEDLVDHEPDLEDEDD